MHCNDTPDEPSPRRRHVCRRSGTRVGPCNSVTLTGVLPYHSEPNEKLRSKDAGQLGAISLRPMS